MSVDDYQSSNELVGKLSIGEDVLAAGKVVLAMGAVGTGFFGFEQVDINQISAVVANPQFELYEYIEAGAPGYQKYLVKCPRTEVSSTTGLATLSVNGNIYWDMGKTGLSLVISAWDRSSSVNKTIYYIVKKNAITLEDVFTP